MKKLIVAGAAMLAATVFSGNAFAIAGGGAKGLEASSSAVKVACGYCARRRHYRGCGCGVTYVPTYTSCGCSSCCGGSFFGIF